MDVFGQNDSGDFDQYSIAGVDFGANYGEDYGIMPTNLRGDVLMSGSDFDQLGIEPVMGNITYTPEMGYTNQLGYENQLGYSNQLGQNPNYTMGSMFDDLKMKFSMLSPTTKYITYAAIALGLVYALRKGNVIKTKLPLIG